MFVATSASALCARETFAYAPINRSAARFETGEKRVPARAGRRNVVSVDYVAIHGVKLNINFMRGNLAPDVGRAVVQDVESYRLDAECCNVMHPS